MWCTSSTHEDVLNGNNGESNKLCPMHNIPDDKILLMMLKMGYKSGLGLGKNKQGIVKPLDIKVKADYCGFGLSKKESNSTWNLEEVSVEETLEWLECNLNINFEIMENWIKIGPRCITIEHESNFCDSNILRTILNVKGMLDQFNEIELLKARSRSNPFEAIKSVFFMNRAALKMANIDACTNFMFTNIDRNPHHQRKDGPYYFADVCAGPGGFSEYILWRKGWGFKGFGLTLKANNDFKLVESNCASSGTFHALYGLNDDGDVCRPENIQDFAMKVLFETEGEGVHFMMSDGGFSVEGNENLQEVLSKQLYLCQCLVALEIVRNNGHFVSKLFDIFTPFSVGLLFLMQFCFRKFAIVKPNASRPANSERYMICYGLRKTQKMLEIKKYLHKIASQFWLLRQGNDNNLDITSIIPLEVIKADDKFTKYITEMNNRLGVKQIKHLQKLIAFCKDPSLIDPRQEMLREKCLARWRIPDRLRILPFFTVKELLEAVLSAPEFMLVPTRNANSMEDVKKYVTDIVDWYYAPMNCEKSHNICNFYAAINGSRVYRLQNHKWVKVKNLSLTNGTILYGEIVKEYDGLDAVEIKSLHIVDAMRLGDVSLADLSFIERLSLIKTYCMAVNFETKSTIRIRPKYAKPLSDLSCDCPIIFDVNESKHIMKLPHPCTSTLRNSFIVNSVLLLKIDENQSFKSTYVLRVQINLSADQNDSNIEDRLVNLNDLLYYLKNKE